MRIGCVRLCRGKTIATFVAAIAGRVESAGIGKEINEIVDAPRCPRHGYTHNAVVLTSLHPAQRRYLAEDLVRLRRSDEQRRYSAPQRAAKVDANPHQIDAVIFALARLREGGCILADEVGLGKTIEAGLVIAQLLAEGARRILLITPKPLLGQWRQELYQLFSIDAHEAVGELGSFDGDGVFLVGREAAGSERGRGALEVCAPFDLCVIDEAHEMFAGIHKRFDKLGDYEDDSAHAVIAGRVYDFLRRRHTPVMLLTATPIQNSLDELWGLVHYVDPMGTLLGDLPTFRELFCNADDRQVIPGQEQELRSRLGSVVQRTLRRDAQGFLEKPFVGRQARLFDYTMSPDEKALYEDVTQYLLEPGIAAFRGNQRQLLLLSFHRLMASSTRALAAGLDGVVRRLRRLLDSDVAGDEGADAELLADLEAGDDEPAPVAREQGAPRPPAAAVRGELRRVEDFVARARALGADDGKMRALLQALRFVLERPGCARKLVIFTESLKTQTYLRERLIDSALVTDEQVTLFAGTNEGPRAQQALQRWIDETKPTAAQRRSRDIAVRLALVHEFRTRSSVFIATEAGAKGLNLQFCDTVVNYDLPWNPQRIEQRIGRCHRYGQQRDVTVINFLARDNLAQQLTFEILSQKLELFGTVLDASDQVLHRASGDLRGEVLVSVLGAEYEAELRRIYDRSRTIEEVTAELQALRDSMVEERRRFEEAHARTAGLIEQHFDGGIQGIFRGYQQRVPLALAELDRDLAAVVEAWLAAEGIAHERFVNEGEEGQCLRVSASPRLPEEFRDGSIAAIGSSRQYAGLSLTHPLVRGAVDAARTAPGRMSATLASDAWSGRRGRLRLLRLSWSGFEKVQELVPVLVFDDGESPGVDAARKLLHAPMSDGGPLETDVDDEALQDATDQALFEIQAAVDEEEHKRFERASAQAERFIEDRLLVKRRRRAELEERLEQGRQRRDGATGSDARSEAEKTVLSLATELDEMGAAIERLERRDNETFQRYLEHIQRRRYAPPLVERLFDLDLEVR